MVLIRLLGPVSANLDDGTRFNPPSVGQRRLLALLAIRAGRNVAASTIGDLFDLSPGAVRTTVSRLRKALGPALRTGNAGYSLDADTDVQRFQALLASARTSPPVEADALRERALKLFTEPALAEFHHEPWAAAEVARLTDMHAAVVEDLVEGRIDAGAFDEAIDHLRQHLTEHRYRDRPHELLMLALARSGRHVEALRAFQEYRSRLADEVGVEPGDAIVALDRLIASGDEASGDIAEPHIQNVAASPTLALTNMYPPANDFVGREADVAEIGKALARSRLVTLQGPGGVGKTRLAYRVAADQMGAFADGAWVAELVHCNDGADVVRTVADIFGLVEGDSADTVADQLAGHEILLVLDNCEHLLADLLPIVESLLTRTARLKLLATSRERIGVVGEQIAAVHPLPMDGTAQRLFVERAESSGAVLSEQDMAAVGVICERLDGIPLALELAAATSRVLSTSELIERLDDRFAVLKGGPRGSVAGRHESMRAAVDSSYDSLDDAAQKFFRRISVFASDFPLAAAEHVAQDLPRSSFDLITELVDRSLLTVQIERGRSRYRMLETLRQYGHDRLADLGEAETAVELHCEWCFDFAGMHRRSAFGSVEAASLHQLVAASANIRLAISRLIDSQQLERATDLVLQLDDFVYASNTLADLVGPVAEATAQAGIEASRTLMAMELVRRSTLGKSSTRGHLARELAESLDEEDGGTLQLPVLLISTALGSGPSASFRAAVIERARAHPTTAERARLLAAAGLGEFYAEELPPDLTLVEEALRAAQQAGMMRLKIAAASMACIGGLRLERPAEGARIARPVLADLSELGEASIMSSGLIAMYTEAALQAQLPAREHLLAIRTAGPNLHGDFNRIGLALARLVQRHGQSALAVRALGACEGSHRSAFSSEQRTRVLETATTELAEREIDSLLAIGEVSEKTDLYREMWAVIEPLLP